MINTLPNLLTLARIGVIPLIVCAFYLPGHAANWTTFSLFVLAAMTDFLDGYFARSRDQKTAFGRIFDPLADKLLVVSCLVMIIAMRQIDVITVVASLAILCREMLVSGLRELLSGMSIAVPVSWFAKCKTTVQMVAIAALLVGDAAPFDLPLHSIGTWGLWFAAILTVYTGYQYFRGGVPHLVQTGIKKDDESPQLSKQSKRPGTATSIKL
tara:strand:- start:1092 stop:1727 length:636 start_codon:yes stop_codon:yes gene_type:complete